MSGDIEFDILLNELVTSLRTRAPLTMEEVREHTIAFVVQHTPEATRAEVEEEYDRIYDARYGGRA